MPDVRPYLIAERYELSSYRKSRRKDWLKTLIYIAIYLTFLGFTGINLLLSYWYVWMTLAAGGLIILVFWHAKATAYHCPRCGHEFEISIFTDFFSPHGVDRKGAWKYLRCPNCSNRSRMEILVKTTGKKAIQSQ
jgi:DNA-directed RNA polymerase subunit RPC12/RpoP